jgi:hypothetical protein
LSLFFDESTADGYDQELKQAQMSKFKAKDIFRSSGLSLLVVSNFHLENDRKKSLNCHTLSSLLLVMGKTHGKVIISDGYQRLCS